LKDPKEKDHFLTITKRLGQDLGFLVKLLPIFAFVIPFLVLYLDRQTSILYYSFEMTWKGRAFYIFFLWLALLEIILGWDVLQSKIAKLRSEKAAFLTLTLLLPTFYLVAANYYSFPSRAIIEYSSRIGISLPDWMPLGVEYFVLAAFFILIVWSQYGAKGLKTILISPAFLATIGLIYTIDNVYMYGSFTPFQIFVPTTATLAARFLNFLGYQTQLSLSGSMPILYAHMTNSTIGFGAAIAWPCSGVESLLIYTVTILLFLKKSVFSLVQKVTLFAIGAIVTYIINVFRIVTIFIIAINTGGYYTAEAQQFHDNYGQLYSIIWIVSYLVIIIGVQTLLERHRKKTATPLHPDPSNGTDVQNGQLLPPFNDVKG
jgi:exosortase/archaeosortase family protein